MTGLVKPRPLQASGTIGVFSPSGALANDAIDRGVETLERRGFRVKVDVAAKNQWRYFAGTDEERLASFHRLLADPEIDALMFSRGGYGISRLLHRIDWPAVARSGKIFCGFSDFTAFNMAAWSKSQLLTYAGPGVATDFDWTDTRPDIVAAHQFMDQHCWPALADARQTAGPFSCEHDYAPQTIEGPLWGSNLSMLTHLVGTPWMPDVEGGILFIEDIGEAPYALERMFFQLFHAGILQRQQAILLADFTDCASNSGRYPYAISDVVDTLRELLSIPVLTGLPFGHVARKLTLPYGGLAVLEIGAGQFQLSY